MNDIPMDQLTEFGRPTASEVAFFKGLWGPKRTYPRHSILRAHGDPVQQIYLLSSGWAASCLDFRNGERQIVKVHIAGDILGAASIALEYAAETLVAVTDVTVRSMPLEAVRRIFFTTPKLATSLFISAQQEQIFLMERLASVGRMSAMSRLVAFLLHMHERLVRIGKPEGLITWPLTQGQIGDVVGLTSVHVNRMMKKLEQQGLTTREGTTIRLNDVAALRDLAGLPERSWISRPDWLAQTSL